MVESLIPNSFQVPNLFVDELEGLLDCEEFKIVVYLSRRIFGFQKRQDRVSLSQLSEGTVAQDGHRLDHGTGLGRATVQNRLGSLKQFGIVRETAPNNRENEGAEYALELDPSRIDIPGLIRRRTREQEAHRRRTEAARRAKGQEACLPDGPPRLPDRPPHPPAEAEAPFPPAAGQTASPACGTDSLRSAAQTAPGLPDNTTPGLSDSPPAVCGTDAQNPGETQGNPGGGERAAGQGPYPDPAAGPPTPRSSEDPGTGEPPTWRHHPERVDFYREIAAPEAAREKLRAAGVSGTSIEYLTSSPQRCYWSLFWATMWPAIEERVKRKQPVSRFITNRVDGAVAGNREDRTEPHEWEPYCARMRHESARRLQAELSRRRDRQRWARPPIQFGAGAEPLWAAFRGAQRETDMAMLADTVRVDLDGDQLRITLCTVTSVECLARRKTALVERARQILPTFPEVQFACGRFEEARDAA